MEEAEKKAAEAKKVADAKAKAEAEKKAAEKKAAEKTEPTKAEVEAKAKAVRLKAEGFFDCTRVKIEKNAQGVISKFGAKVNDIKAMHESNIDVYNSQQVNSGMFIKKKGVKYELVEVNVPGRKRALKMFMEAKKS